MADIFSVARLYVATFNRAADAAGLEYWVKDSGLEIDEIAQSFFEQPETEAMYPDTLSNELFVGQIYRNLFNREGETEGIAYWSKQLEEGTVARSTMILAFIKGAQGDDALILQHKTGASLYYADCMLNDPSLAYEAVQNINAGVESLQEAKNRIDGMDTMHSSGLGTLPSSQMPQVQALLFGKKWEDKVVTYSFNETIPPEYYETGDKLTRNWHPFTDNERQIVHNIFAKLEQQIDIDFVEVSEEGEIRYNKIDMDGSKTGFSYYPDSNGRKLAGDVFIANDYDSEEGNAPGTDAWLTFVHETGHALGLKHPFEGTHQLSDEEDNTLYTVMTYTAKGTTKIEFSYDNEVCRAHFPINTAPDAYQLYDIMALQSIYGANTHTSTESDTYDLSQLSHNGKYALIWDAGGNDTIDLSKTDGENHIFLKDGTLSSVDLDSIERQIDRVVSYFVMHGCEKTHAKEWVESVFDDPDVQQFLYMGENNLAISQGVRIENVITGNGNDIIYDNALDNIIKSGGGNDQIYLSEGGYDIVMGDSGNDRVYLDGISSDYLVYHADADRWLLEAVNTENSHIELWGVETIVFDDGSFSLA